MIFFENKAPEYPSQLSNLFSFTAASSAGVYAYAIFALFGIWAGPKSLLVMKPIAPRPKPAIYPFGGGPKLGFLKTNF